MGKQCCEVFVIRQDTVESVTSIRHLDARAPPSRARTRAMSAPTTPTTSPPNDSPRTHGRASPATPRAGVDSVETRSASEARRGFGVDDFLRVEDVARGEREWRDVRPCVRRAIEGVAYVLRRHERGIDSARGEVETLRRRAEAEADERWDAGEKTPMRTPSKAMEAVLEVDALKLELAEARNEAAERRVEALEDAVRQLREELQSSRAIHTATLERVAALETLQATTSSKVAVDLFELETQISVKATEGAEAAASAMDERLNAMSGQIADVTTLVRELEVEAQETRMKTNQTALSLAAADVPSIVSELEIVKSRATRASQDAVAVNEALVEVRELSQTVERLSEECNDDLKRVLDQSGHVQETYNQFKESLARAEKMESEANDIVQRITSRGQETLEQIETNVQRISALGDEIASTSEQHAHLVQEQGEVLAGQLKEWGAKVVEKVSEQAESTVTEVMQSRLREIESSTDSAAARNAERAAQETRKCVSLAEEALRKADDENNSFKESVLSSVNRMQAASERADELKQWIKSQHTAFAELREESIAALKGSEKSSVDTLSKVAEEHTRTMKRVLGEAEATRGITEAGTNTRIDRLDEMFHRFEERMSTNELRVESCEVTMRLEKAAAKPTAEAQANAIATLEKNVMHSVSLLERDLRDEMKSSSKKSLQVLRKELVPIQDAVFGVGGGSADLHEFGYSPSSSPMSTPRKMAHIETYSQSLVDSSGSIQGRLANLAQKQDEQSVIIQSMHESMERTLRDRPSTLSVRELFDDVSKRVDALQESVDWSKTDRSKTKRTLTELRAYVDDRCTKMETTALRDWNKLGMENAEMHVSRESQSLDYGRKFVTHPELQAAISIVEDHIKRLSRRMANVDVTASVKAPTRSDEDLISF